MSGIYMRDYSPIRHSPLPFRERARVRVIPVFILEHGFLTHFIRGWLLDILI